MLTHLEHLSSSPVFYWGSCYSIFSFICMFCRSLFVLLYFFFGHCIGSSSSIYDICLSLWYLQKNWGWTQVLQMGKHFLLHMWHPSCYSSYKAGDKSSMRKGPDCNYDERNISVVICDTDTQKKQWIWVITKLPNSEQSSKGKVKTHKHINRQNQVLSSSTTYHRLYN
jgi:hypothetical protein